MSVKNVERTFKNSDYFLHSHKNNCEILYITTGIGKVKAYDEVIQVVPGDIIFCPRNFEHTGPGGNCELIYVVADIPIPKDMNKHFVIKDDNKYTMRNFFETIYDVFTLSDNNTAYKNIESSLCELIFELAFHIKRMSDQDEEVNALYREINRRFGDMDFSVGCEMERISNSVTYLRRKFNESLGMSPSKYLNSVRIGHAKKLIARRMENHMSMADIAYLCGFRDERYFARVFKEYCGMTPGDYYKNVI